MPGEDEQGRQEALLRQAVRWGAAGIEYVQLREKDLGAGELAALARRVLEALGGSTQLLIGSRVDVAMAVGAAGVHLTAEAGGLTVGQVREVMPGAVVSVSCHSVEDVRQAAEVEASFVLFGPVYEKRVGGVVVVGGVGLDRLAEACRVGVPVLALGGVTGERVGECEGAGAVGWAGIRAFR